MKAATWTSFALLLYLCSRVVALPVPVLSGWAEVGLGEARDSWGSQIALLHDAGLNTLQAHLTPANFDVTDPQAWGTLERLAREARAADLALVVVVPDAGSGRRDPAAPDWLIHVGPDGRSDPTRYCLCQYSSWRHAYDRLFALAARAADLHLAGLVLDLERLADPVPCLCADCFGAYAKAQGQAGAVVAREERWAWVLAHGGAEAYEQHLEGRLGDIAQRLAAAVHDLAPSLSLGIFPYRNDFLRRPWARHLGSVEAPALLMSRALFSGAGYTAEADVQAAHTRELSPHALYLPSLRVNAYRPDDLKAQAHVTATRADGYNLWAVGMIAPQDLQDDQPETWRLPPDSADPLLYWQALGEANRQIAQWAQGPREPAPWSPLARPMPGVDPDSGSVQPVRGLRAVLADTDMPTPSVLFGSNALVVAVEDAAEAITVRLQIPDNAAASLPLAYALVTPGGYVVREGRVVPGAVEQLALRVPAPGSYGLLLAGPATGRGYSVRLTSHSYGVVATGDGAHFGRGPRQYFVVPAGIPEFRLACAVTSGGTGRLRVYDGAGAMVMDSTTGDEADSAGSWDVTVPAGQDAAVWSLQVEPAQPLPAGGTPWQYRLALTGIPAYLSDRPGAVVVPAY